LKNPFLDQNKIVTLDLNSRPILYHGQFQGYSQRLQPQTAERLSVMGLRFNRMISEELAVYGVMAGNSTVPAPLISPFSESQVIGQLAVMVAPETGELNLQRDWDVEPRGNMEGRNGFGISIAVPMVKFWHYRDQRSSAPSPAPPNLPSPPAAAQNQ